MLSDLDKNIKSFCHFLLNLICGVNVPAHIVAAIDIGDDGNGWSRIFLNNLKERLVRQFIRVTNADLRMTNHVRNGCNGRNGHL